MKSVNSHKHILNKLGVEIEDLDHHSGMLLARLYPEVSEAAYLVSVVLLLRQKDGAIAIPWSAAKPSVLDLLIENLSALQSSLKPEDIRTVFPHMVDISIQHLVDAGAIVSVTNPKDSYTNAVIIHDMNRLYLRRFWRYEVDVAEMVTSRSVLLPHGENGSHVSKPSENLQNQAISAGLNYRFTVITGGPGTGKTHSVLLLLTAMLGQNPELRIVLCAPTGKAAARMMESIQGNLERINPPPAIRDGIPDSASTIHRLIRWNPAQGKSVYHAENPLPYDVVILDEASMVDVALMSRLARALRPETRLILLGDKDQLSSVEAGSVFADIASRGAPNVVRLTKSWRFKEDSQIGRLAQVINDGDAGVSWSLLQSGGEVSLMESASARKEDLYSRLGSKITALHAALVDERDHARALAQLQGLQVLSALRVGPYGSEQINAEMDRRVGKGAVWYDGRAVIATSNNYDLEVYNGDVGLARMVDGRLMVAFAGSEAGVVRWIAPAQLKSVSSAWALTVHKSQGSEYDEVVFVLPDRWTPVLSRELVYTALTRARGRFSVWGSREIWKRALGSRVERYSGLADRLGDY
ncbi:MAG: exodeoxyribonuclease V subunit alpha [Balneolales bacterium]|nr:exodeoxyribonuclease V subunit alpha [Balneolales bacterium]